MKYKRLYFVLSLLLIPVITAGCPGKTTPAPSGDGQTPAGSLYGPVLPAGYVILDRQTGDVTGDKKPKDIFLLGRKPGMDSNFADDISILVQDKTTRNVLTVKLPNVGGYNSKLFLGDFTGDKIADVFVTIPSGGSGGYVEHRIVTFVGEPRVIFGESENKGIVATGRFLDGFRAELTEASTKRKAIIDLSNKKDMYIKANIYNTGGKLLRQQQLSVSPLEELDSIEVTPGGTYELKGVQRVTGIYNADTVAHIYSIWEYRNQKWTTQQIEVSSVLLGYGENQQDAPIALLLNSTELAREGKVINCEFPANTTTIQDVEEKWGKPDKTNWIPAAKGTYATYSKHNVVFGYNKGSQIFEVISLDSRLKNISLSMVKETLGSPNYNAKSNGQETLGYTAGRDYKLLLFFSQPANGSAAPSLKQYSVLYPQGTVNLMADDPGREW
ncbi:Hypothetical protein LUCI_0404 [Lucifera butyrica]|uniref:Uncharacterized protein n=1 Tax=Lucifera butyrica TaxID=1351585 RepID=A0A498R2Z7_9FIRM|nr:YjgB family protein [Lucifera butyrica]VBB05197.1 Hypothetical protein LUCI_0404 [Lucifera butyrica]